jgi:hypothetical protein
VLEALGRLGVKRVDMKHRPRYSALGFLGEFGLGIAVACLMAGFTFAQSDSGQSASQGGADKPSSSDKKDKNDVPKTKLKIEITDPNDKPVGNASVYIRFNIPGGPLRKDKLAELNLKTNDDGSAKAPEIPQGKILIQVIAKGWKTYGKWYDINKDEDTIEIKLESPPHWY